MSAQSDGVQPDPVDHWRRILERGSFEEVYASLEDVVTRLEAGRLPLETSLAYYELGILLGERCSRILEDAELRISRLDQTQTNGTGGSEDTWPDDDEDILF